MVQQSGWDRVPVQLPCLLLGGSTVWLFKKLLYESAEWPVLLYISLVGHQPLILLPWLIPALVGRNWTSQTVLGSDHSSFPCRLVALYNIPDLYVVLPNITQLIISQHTKPIWTYIATRASLKKNMCGYDDKISSEWIHNDANALINWY